MKITKSQLKQIIKEELSSVMTEAAMSFEEDVTLTIKDARRALTNVAGANRYAKRLLRDLSDLRLRVQTELDESSPEVRALEKRLTELIKDLKIQLNEEGGFDEDYLQSMKGWLNGLVLVATKGLPRAS